MRQSAKWSPRWLGVKKPLKNRKRNRSDYVRWQCNPNSIPVWLPRNHSFGVASMVFNKLLIEYPLCAGTGDHRHPCLTSAQKVRGIDFILLLSFIGGMNTCVTYSTHCSIGSNRCWQDTNVSKIIFYLCMLFKDHIFNNIIKCHWCFLICRHLFESLFPIG